MFFIFVFMYIKIISKSSHLYLSENQSQLCVYPCTPAAAYLRVSTPSVLARVTELGMLSSCSMPSKHTLLLQQKTTQYGTHTDLGCIYILPAGEWVCACMREKDTHIYINTRRQTPTHRYLHTDYTLCNSVKAVQIKTAARPCNVSALSLQGNGVRRADLKTSLLPSQH